MNLSERIKLARKKAGLTQSQLAELVGIAQTAISQLESGKTLRTSYLVHIATSCGVNSAWLASGVGEMESPEDDKALLRTQVEEALQVAQTDDSRLNQALRERIATLRAVSRFAPSKLELTEQIPYLIELDDPNDSSRTVVEVSVKIHIDINSAILMKQDAHPGYVVATAILGNSMTPILQDGGTVLANLLETQVVDGRIYVIDHGGQIRVKALYRLPGGGVRMRSYNFAEHPDESYSASDIEEARIRVMGRVFWGTSFY